MQGYIVVLALEPGFASFYTASPMRGLNGRVYWHT